MRNALALFAALFLALSACNEPEEECTSCNKVSNLVERGKKEIGAGNFSDGVQLCESALEIDSESTDARYCAVIGRLGSLSLAINSIFTRLGSLLPDPEPDFSPAIDYRQILKGFLNDSEDELTAIDAHLYELAKVDQLQFQINFVPIHLKFQKIADYLNTYFLTGEYQLPGELIFNAGGTWDRSEIVTLGAVFNAVLGILDFSLAHDFNLSNVPASSNLDAMVAELFIVNPDLLQFAPTEEARARLHGSSVEKGFSNDLIAMLSYVSGRETDLENAAPANPGFKAAFIESAALASTDAVIQWIDDDGDGHLDAIESRIFGDISDQLVGVRVDRIPSFLGPDTLDALYALTTALLDNIENEGDPASPNALLEGLRSDFGGLFTVDSLVHKKIPDFVQIAPGTFLKAPIPLRRMLPLYYEIDHPYGDGSIYGLLIELEVDEYGGAEKYYFDFDDRYFNYSSSLDHFTDLPNEAFKEFTPLSGVAINDDGVNPNSSASVLLYLGMQSPSFGGLIYVDPSALGGSAVMGEATNQTLNEIFARLMKYYCFDFGYARYGYYDSKFQSYCPEGSENQ